MSQSIAAIAQNKPFGPTPSKSIKMEEVTYSDATTKLGGTLVYDSSKKGPRPGVIVVHDWMGPSDYTKLRASQLASLGYAAFVADIYGIDTRPKNQKEAGETAGKFKKDRTLLRKRVNLALEEFQKSKLVDPKKIGAIGYCFGGTTVIELARSGAPIVGVVSFHGGLDSPTPADGKNIKAKVLALHGADDPYVSSEDLAAFEKEMRDATVNWELVKLGNAVHSFSNPGAGDDKSKGNAYYAPADKRSFELMAGFFKENF
ncbi:MAG: dienelactone hydrolase family protein [Proteobacteria bacterium]|nr:dienelactone hydrolase family protein [Pseudomonadota bacterium]